jgi:hypothetical protein
MAVLVIVDLNLFLKVKDEIVVFHIKMAFVSAMLWGGCRDGNTGDLVSRAEHYEKLAHKYHELAKVAQPAYLGDFYRGVAVRYIFMAQEVSERAKKASEFTADGRAPSVAEFRGQDLELLVGWAGDRSRSEEST